MPISYTIIVSGASVSADIDLSQYALVAIGVPVITSGDLLFQCNFDTTSATFYRVQRIQPNTGDMRWATGPGSVMIHALVDIPIVPYARLETSVAQADTRTLTLLVR